MSWVGKELAQVLRELARPVDLGRPWRDALIGEGADGVSEERLLLGQSVAGLHRLGLTVGIVAVDAARSRRAVP